MDTNNRPDTKILFLPGWMTKRHNYSDLLTSFSHLGTVLYHDFKGFDDKSTEEYTVTKYIDHLIEFLTRRDFSPDIIVGYSFGGKIGLMLNEHYPKADYLLIAPSSFKPTFKRRFLTKLKVCIYKVLKTLKRWRLIKEIPENFKGSNDYRRTSGVMRKTFLNVKDSYVSDSSLKHIINKVYMLGYQNDEHVELNSLKRGARKLKNAQLFVSGGDHYQLFYDATLVNLLLERLVGERWKS